MADVCVGREEDCSETGGWKGRSGCSSARGCRWRRKGERHAMQAGGGDVMMERRSRRGDGEQRDGGLVDSLLTRDGWQSPRASLARQRPRRRRGPGPGRRPPEGCLCGRLWGAWRGALQRPRGPTRISQWSTGLCYRRVRVVVVSCWPARRPAVQLLLASE